MIPDIDFDNDVSVVMLDPNLPIDSDFECKNESYTEYYRVTAFSDMKEGIGQTWLCMYKKKMIGFVSIAMAHMNPERDKQCSVQKVVYHLTDIILLTGLRIYLNYYLPVSVNFWPVECDLALFC